jgi:hypothetical protein
MTHTFTSKSNASWSMSAASGHGPPAILDGIDRHLDGRLIDQAVRTARRTGLLRRADVAEITTARAAR